MATDDTPQIPEALQLGLSIGQWVTFSTDEDGLVEAISGHADQFAAEAAAQVEGRAVGWVSQDGRRVCTPA